MRAAFSPILFYSPPSARSRDTTALAVAYKQAPPPARPAADALAWANPVTLLAIHCQDHPEDRDALPRLLQEMKGITCNHAKEWLRIIGTGGDFDDLMQAGRMGVLKAAEKFDRGRGVQFSTYVKHWIRATIGIWAGKQSTGTMPYPLSNMIRGARRTAKGYSAECVEAARRCSHPLSIDHEESHHGWLAWEAEPGLDDDERERLHAAVSRLPEPMRRAIRLRYGLDGGEPMLLREVAVAMGGYTREGMRKLLLRALSALRADLNASWAAIRNGLDEAA